MTGRSAYSLLLACFACLTLLHAQQRERDSLNRVYLTAHDTLKVQVLTKLSRLLEANQPDSALFMADSALIMAKRLNYLSGMGQAYISVGSCQTTAGRYDQGIQHLLKAVEIFEKLNNRRALSNVYNSIANAYVGLQNNRKAYEFFLKSYNTAKEPPAIEFMVAVSSVGLGGVLMEDKKFDEAISYIQQAEDYFGKINNLNYQALATSMIGEAYSRAGNYSAAEKYYRRVIPIFRKLNDTYGLASTLGNLGALELDRKNYQQALVFLTEALTLHQERKAWDNIQSVALSLAQAMEGLNQPAKALEYYKTYMQYKDSVINVQRNKAVADAESRYESEKKEQALKIKNMELEASQTQVSLRSRLLYVFAGAVLLALVLLFFVFKQYKEKKNANLQLTAKNKEVEAQKFIIEEKNKDITDSINYARHIQQAIIPGLAKMKEALPQLFVVFKPKDIVSGDFYAIEKTEDCIYLAVVDCTGHGVPGAMLSVFANSSLKNIISTGTFKTDPAGILTELCRHFKNNLQDGQQAGSINDGADIGICILHPGKNQLYFAGAKIDLYRVRQGAMEEFFADRYGISGTNSSNQTRFANHTIELQKQDKFYLFTDGYADQFGGPKGKKFKRKKLEDLLLSFSTQPFEAQGAVLDQAFENWKGRLEQLDDVTVAGFEIT
jgi:serine phosphatase RsbU (regulator of sigma subunit)